jgi:hypothetical protein
LSDFRASSDVERLTLSRSHGAPRVIRRKNVSPLCRWKGVVGAISTNVFTIARLNTNWVARGRRKDTTSAPATTPRIDAITRVLRAALEVDVTL